MALLTQWTLVCVDSRSCWWTERPGVLLVHGVAKCRIQLSDWTERNWTCFLIFPMYGHTGLHWWLSGKESTYNLEDSGQLLGWKGSLGKGNGNPLQYCCLGNPMDRGAWWATLHRVAMSWTWLKQLSMHACHYLSELAQLHIHAADDGIQPSHPLLFPSPPAFNLYQHQGLFQWVSSSHQVAKVLEF